MHTYIRARNVMNVLHWAVQCTMPDVSLDLCWLAKNDDNDDDGGGDKNNNTTHLERRFCFFFLLFFGGDEKNEMVDYTQR